MSSAKVKSKPTWNLGNAQAVERDRGFPGAHLQTKVELACNLLRKAVMGGASHSGRVSGVVTGTQKTKQIIKIKQLRDRSLCRRARSRSLTETGGEVNSVCSGKGAWLAALMGGVRRFHSLLLFSQ